MKEGESGYTGSPKKTTTSPTTPPPGYIPGLPPAWVPTATIAPPAPAPVYVPGVPTGMLPSNISTTPAPAQIPQGSWNLPSPSAPSGGGGGPPSGGIQASLPTLPQSFVQQALNVLDSILAAAPPMMQPAAAGMRYGLQSWQAAAVGQTPPTGIHPAVPLPGFRAPGPGPQPFGYQPPPVGYQSGIPPAWSVTGPGVPRPTAPATTTTQHPYLPLIMRGPGFEATTPTLRETYASTPGTLGAGTLPTVTPPPVTPLTTGGGYYGGGGGGGYAPAATAEGLPVVYQTWFESIFGPVATYYTPERGGVGQAYKDYQSLQYLWQSLTGTLPTIEQLNGILLIVKQYLGTLERTPGFTDVLDYVRWLGRPKGNPPPVSYLNVGEL